MIIEVIFLNGASSSGKTSIARCLQAKLTTPWLRLGIDDLIRAMPDKGIEDGSLLSVSQAGLAEVGPGWLALETSWYIGVASIAASGTGIIVDEVLLDGGASQERLRTAFSGLEMFWVGVKCDGEVARAREALRPDRVPGMAESQAAVVHEGVAYDLIARPLPCRALPRSWPKPSRWLRTAVSLMCRLNAHAFLSHWWRVETRPVSEGRRARSSPSRWWLGR